MSENTEQNNGYKDSLKATTLFGGVQIYNILIQLIRSKFVALLLGPSGMGIYNLFSSTTVTISTITSLGLTRSSVRNIAEIESTNNPQRLLEVIAVFRKLVWFTGLIALLFCLLFSKLLSIWTFGSTNYSLGFAILSLSLLFQQLTSGQTTVMQGLRKYRIMAKSNVVGNTIGLLITIPLFYLFEIDAIVPVLIISSIISLVVSIYYYKKLNISNVYISREVIKKDGGNMIYMGVALSITSVIGVIASYVLRVFIERNGGLSDVGLFAAGYSIVYTYVGLVMNAMTTDYYPRLCSVNTEIQIFSEIINNQMNIGFTILAPLITIFAIFIRLIVIILYSEEFSPVEGMMYWAMFSTYFQMFALCLSHTFLAKGDYKFYISSELLSNLYVIPSQFLGYYYGGLTGLGIAFLVGYFIYAIQVYAICSYRYKVNINRETIYVFLKYLPTIVACLYTTQIENSIVKYTVGSILILITFVLSLYDLNKKINIVSILRNRLKK